MNPPYFLEINLDIVDKYIKSSGITIEEFWEEHFELLKRHTISSHKFNGGGSKLRIDGLTYINYGKKDETTDS